MFWIGFVVGVLVIPALACLTWLVFVLIDAIPYEIKSIKKYFNDKKEKKGLVDNKKQENTNNEIVNNNKVDIDKAC